MTLEGMLKEVTVKEKDEYVLGIYNNRIPIYGLYLKAKNNSLLERIEIMAKAKFKLEKDSENYVQQARMETYIAINKFYELHGDKEFNEEFFKSFVFKAVKGKLQNLAVVSKSNASIVDRNTNKYDIKDIFSIDDLLSTLKEEDKTINEDFVEWLNTEGMKVLTKRQVQYLNNEIIVDRKNLSKIHNNIASRLLSYYGELEYDMFKEINKRNIIVIKETILMQLIYNKEFEEWFCEYINKNKSKNIDELINYIYDELDFEYYKSFTACLKEGRYIDNKLKRKLLNILENYKKNYKE